MAVDHRIPFRWSSIGSYGMTRGGGTLCERMYPSQKPWSLCMILFSDRNRKPRFPLDPDEHATQV